MVNKDRIVPVTKVDLLSLYATVLKITVGGDNEHPFAVIPAETVDGDFSIAESVSGIANQPVKSFTCPEDLEGCSVFFIPDYTYEGVYINGVKVEPSGDEVDASSANLYVLGVNAGAASITALTPTL